MNFTKKAYLLNKYRIETEGLEGAREATARTVEWDGHEVKNATPIAKGEEPIRPHDQKDVLLVSPVGVKNRLVDTVLPAQEKVERLGNEVESPVIPAEKDWQLADKERSDSAEVVEVEKTLERTVKFRRIFTPAEIGELEKSFQKTHYVSSEDQEDLAKSLGIKKEQVSVWLRNRISREKRTLLKDKNADSLDPSNRPSKSSATPKSNQYKKKLERFSPTAKDILNKSYEKSEWLTIEMTTSLVEKTGLSRRQVQMWYAKKRESIKLKNEKFEAENIFENRPLVKDEKEASIVKKALAETETICRVSNERIKERIEAEKESESESSVASLKGGSVVSDVCFVNVASNNAEESFDVPQVKKSSVVSVQSGDSVSSAEQDVVRSMPLLRSILCGTYTTDPKISDPLSESDRK